MNKYLLVNPFGIGDVLFTTPVLQALKQADPSCEIGYWCNERVQGLFRADPMVSRVFALSRGDLKRTWSESPLAGIRTAARHFSSLRKTGYDAAIDFSLDDRYGLVCALAGIGKRVGFDYKGRGRFLTGRIPLESYHDRHIAEYYLDLLKLLGVERPRHPQLRLHVSDAAHAKAQHLLSRAGVIDAPLLIGIAGGAGASWGKDAELKHWPAVKFAQLVDRIHRELDGSVVLLGSEAERPIADVIMGMARAKPVDLVGRTTLEEFAAVMSYMKVLVANDGGPLHMAVALGVRTVSIFGPVDSAVYGPYPPGPDHAVIQRELECRPCYRQFRMPACTHRRECISGIETSEVFEALKTLSGEERIET